MKSFNLVVLLFCLITYGHSRPSDADERDEIMRESKKEKYFQHDSAGETPLHQTESPVPENGMLNRLKSIAHLRVAETIKPAAAVAADSLTRQELEALRDLLDRNLQKYQNYDERSVKRRPDVDPYVDRNGEPSSGAGQQHPSHHRPLPVRRKIIRHTVFATPQRRTDAAAAAYPNGPDERLYDASRVDWTSPWAEYFPILIKDPFQTMVNSFSEIIEYGPAADICRRSDGGGGGGDEPSADRWNGRRTVGPGTLRRSRRNTAPAAAANAAEEEKGVLNHVPRPFRPHHHGTTTESPKVYHWATDRPAAEHNGDTGPQIKRLVVRRGGVAIAGPGGIATAGSGGTAIVGPGGSAYSSKDTASGATADATPAMGAGGVSMAGYGPQVVQGPQAPPTSANFYAAYPPPHHFYNNNVGYGRSAGGGGGATSGGGTAVLSADGVVYSFPVPSRGLTAAGGAQRRRDDGGGQRQQRTAAGAREIVLPDGAKLIATGPIVYYNPEPADNDKNDTKKKKKKTTKKTRKGRGDRKGNDVDDEDDDADDDQDDDDDDDEDGPPRRSVN